jgi:hypothetical protein
MCAYYQPLTRECMFDKSNALDCQTDGRQSKKYTRTLKDGFCILYQPSMMEVKS